nr:U1 small nuclear ribonucleoprotein C-like [Ipomoea batatas]
MTNQLLLKVLHALCLILGLSLTRYSDARILQQENHQATEKILDFSTSPSANIPVDNLSPGLPPPHFPVPPNSGHSVAGFPTPHFPVPPISGHSVAGFPTPHFPVPPISGHSVAGFPTPHFPRSPISGHSVAGFPNPSFPRSPQSQAIVLQERNELPDVGFRAAVAIPEWHSRERSWGLDRNDQVSAEKSKTVVKFPLSRAHLISFLNKIWVHINRSLRVIHSTWSGAIKWISTLGNQMNDAQVTYLADKFCIKENIRRFQVPMDKTRAAGVQKDKSRTYLNSNSNPILPMKEARSCLGEKVIFKVAIVKIQRFAVPAADCFWFKSLRNNETQKMYLLAEEETMTETYVLGIGFPSLKVNSFP